MVTRKGEIVADTKSAQKLLNPGDRHGGRLEIYFLGTGGRSSGGGAMGSGGWLRSRGSWRTDRRADGDTEDRAEGGLDASLFYPLRPHHYTPLFPTVLRNLVTLWPTMLYVLVRRRTDGETKCSFPATLANTESTLSIVISRRECSCLLD